MKLFATAAISATFAMTAAIVNAQSMIDELCGQGHSNEARAAGDVQANPNGYYVRSLAEQLSHGDPRIVLAAGDEFHLCTRPAAIPGMDAASAANAADRRTVKYLFVPAILPDTSPSS